MAINAIDTELGRLLFAIYKIIALNNQILFRVVFHGTYNLAFALSFCSNFVKS